MFTDFYVLWHEQKVYMSTEWNVRENIFCVFSCSLVVLVSKYNSRVMVCCMMYYNSDEYLL